MTAIVKSALRHPYTFVVMALLIMIFGVSSALRTPTDIFRTSTSRSAWCSATPTCRRTTPGAHRDLLRRAVSTVNDIQHIRSQ